MRRIKGLVFLAIAAMLVFGLVGSAFAAVGSDVQGTKYQVPVAQLSALGIVTGYEDGSIKPDQTITRAEFCAIAVRATNMKGNLTSAATKFPDVPASHWASGYISLAAGKGYIIGYDDGNFYPENPVTVAEAVTILTRILGYGPAVDNNNWPDSFISKASEIGVLKGVSVSANNPAPRGDVFLMTANSLDIDIMKQVQYGSETIYEVQDDPSKTILSEFFDIDVYDDVDELPVVAKTMKIDLDTLEPDEVKFADPNDSGISTGITYTVAGGIDPAAFLGQEVVVWVDDDDIVYYLGASEDQTVLVDELEKWNFDDGDIDEVKLDNSNDEYTVLSDCTIFYNIDSYSYSSFNSKVNGNAKYAAGSSLKVILNDKDEVTAMVIDNYADSNAEYGIVESVNGEKIEFVDDTGASKLDLEDYDYMVVKNGSNIALTDIQADDVVNYFEGDDVAYLVVTSKKLTGEIEDVRASSADIVTYDIYIGGKKYDCLANTTFSDDNNDTVDLADNDDLDDLTGKDASVYLDAQDNVRHIVVGDATTSNKLVGVVLEDANYDDFDDVVKVKILTKEGKEVTFKFDPDDVELDGEEDITPAEFKAALKPSTADNNFVAFEYKLDSDGDMKSIDLLENISSYAIANGTDVSFDEDDDTITVDGDTLSVESNTIIFDISDAANWDGDIDDGKVVSWDSIKDTDDSDLDRLAVVSKDGDTKAKYVFILDAASLTSDAQYGVLHKFTKVSGDDALVLITKDGEKTLVYEDADIDADVLDRSGLKRGDFIQYTLDSAGEIDDIIALAAIADTVNIATYGTGTTELYADGPTYEAIDIDKVAQILVEDSSSTKITGTQFDGTGSVTALVNSSTVYMRIDDGDYLKVVNGVDDEDYVLCIDTDDDGGAYDYVIIVKRP